MLKDINFYYFLLFLLLLTGIAVLRVLLPSIGIPVSASSCFIQSKNPLFFLFFSLFFFFLTLVELLVGLIDPSSHVW